MRLRQDHRRAVPAETLGQCPYAEGDEFHTQANRDKMGAGIPLTDEDRYPWLGNLRDWMTKQAQNGADHTIVTCSASNAATATFCAEPKAKLPSSTSVRRKTSTSSA
ncbi:glucokinase [Neisseria meningitidis]|nr:glucokinase [Neisseria meningitidis]